MNKKILVGSIIGVVVVVLVVLGIFMYANNGGNLANAVNCGSCTGDKSAGCSSITSGCSSSQVVDKNTTGTYQTQDLQVTDTASIETSAVEFYTNNYGENGITAKAEQSGCCMLVTILKDGSPIDHLKYKDGQFSK